MTLLQKKSICACAVIIVTVVGAYLASAATLSTPDDRANYVRPEVVTYPDANPFSPEKQRLGEMLFFDPRLSGKNNLSCASCHNPSLAWGDGQAKWFGPNGFLKRRTPTIINLFEAELVMWDGRKPSLESQAMGPLESADEMGQDLDDAVAELQAIPEYRTLFKAAFPDKPISPDTIGMAIATYERGIISGIAPFDRWVKGDEKAISDAAKRGFALFNGKANCAACHSGWNFTDHAFYDVGMPDADIGRGAHLNLPSMQHAFKTPTLREATRRGPYMHDGSIATLRGVVEHYNKGGVDRPSRSPDVRPLSLTVKEVDDLVAFLETLTGEQRRVTVPVLPVVAK